MEDLYSREQIQTVLKPRFYPRLCQSSVKIITVINRVSACVRAYAENDHFPREFGDVFLMSLFILSFYVVVCQYNIIAGNFGFVRC